jgi:capsular exopolysaccharide synthesis family protein
LAKKQKELDQFRAEKALLLTDPDKQAANIERLRGITEQLNQAKIEALAAKTDHEESLRSTFADPEKMKKVQELLSNGGFAMLSADDMKLLRTELLGYETRLSDVKGQYGANHPTAQLLQRRVDQLRISYAAAVERRYQLAQQRQADVQKLYDEQTNDARDQANKAAEYARLQERVTTLQKHVEMLDGRIKEVNLAEDGGTPNITILEPAHVDDKPSYPSKQKTLAIALILGLIAGTGASVVRDRYDAPLTSAREIKNVLGTRVLGFIPHLAPDAALGMRRMTAHAASSDIAEASRSLYSTICFSIPADRVKTIVVTSPARSDGKTTLAGNLAIAMAQQGKRVLLVNADFRSPALDRIFELEGRHGLANVLEGKEIPEAAVHESGINGLDVLPSGNILKNPVEMLNTQRFMAVLEHLSDVYDHVVIDAPPAVVVNDARIIAAHCDVTLLVLRAGRSNRRQSEMARDGLLAVGANLLGVVVNDVSPRAYGQYDGVYEDLAPLPAQSSSNGNSMDPLDPHSSSQVDAWLARRPAGYRSAAAGSSAGAQPMQRSSTIEHVPERDETV